MCAWLVLDPPVIVSRVLALADLVSAVFRIRADGSIRHELTLCATGYHGGSARTPYEGASYYGRSRPQSYYDQPPPQQEQQRRYGPHNRNSSDPMMYGSNTNGAYGQERMHQQQAPLYEAAPAPVNGGTGMYSHERGYPAQPSYDAAPAQVAGTNGMYGQERGHQQQPSYDAATASTSGSYGTENGTASTDPSFHNSSKEQIAQANGKPDPADVYGFSGFGGGGPKLQGPILEEHRVGQPAYGQPGYGNGQRNGYQGNSMPPQPPAHGANGMNGAGNELRRPISLGKPNGGGYNGAPASRIKSPPQYGDGQTDKQEKRKSWLKRTFSRNG